MFAKSLPRMPTKSLQKHTLGVSKQANNNKPKEYPQQQESSGRRSQTVIPYKKKVMAHHGLSSYIFQYISYVSSPCRSSFHPSIMGVMGVIGLLKMPPWGARCIPPISPGSSPSGSSGPPIPGKLGKLNEDQLLETPEGRELLRGTKIPQIPVDSGRLRYV